MEILPVIRVTRHRYGGAGVGWGTRDVRKVYPLILISSDQNGVAADGSESLTFRTAQRATHRFLMQFFDLPGKCSR